MTRSCMFAAWTWLLQPESIVRLGPGLGLGLVGRGRGARSGKLTSTTGASERLASPRECDCVCRSSRRPASHSAADASGGNWFNATLCRRERTYGRPGF